MSINIEQIMNMVLKAAESARTDAGFSGGWGDGGAARMEDQVRFYRYGLQCVVPPEWKKYEEQLQREADPEYDQYLRLQKKFGRTP